MFSSIFSINQTAMKIYILLFLIISNIAFSDILRVEPPNWWCDFNARKLELLVYGPKIGSTSKVEVLDKNGRSAGEIIIDRLKKTDNPNYLFIEITLKNNMRPGEFDFILSGDSQNYFSYTFLSRNKESDHAVAFDASDVFYLLMPDRFSNGDNSNDNIKGMRCGTNRKVPGERHGGDLKGVSDKLNYLKDLGITTIWMTPVFENDMPVSYGEYAGQIYGAYHGYAATDMYQIDRRFGTNDDYRNLVDKAQKMGLKVVMDVVHNHVGSYHWWALDPPNKDWFHDMDVYGITNYENVVIADPYSSKYDVEKLTKGYFDKAMPDLNQKNPLLSKYLVQHSLWWIEYSGINGIRMDTYPYVNKEHMKVWCDAVLNEYPKFGLVGEAWALSPVSVAYWQNDFLSSGNYDSNLPSVIDFPVSFSIRNALSHNANPNAIREIHSVLSQDLIYSNPNLNLIFIDNHDSNRFFEVVGKDHRKYKMGIALLSVLRGVPQVYYGTEINLKGTQTKGDADIRRDFPGGWNDDDRNAFTKEGRTKEENEIFEFCKRLFNWRKKSSAVHGGELVQFVPLYEDNIYTVFRYDSRQVVGLFINPNQDRVDVQTDRFQEMTEGFDVYVDVMDGKEKDWGDILPIEPVGFRLVEFER